MNIFYKGELIKSSKGVDMERGGRLDKLEKNIRESFKNLKLELEDHLDSINDNTNELEHFSEIIYEFDNRLNKIEDTLEFIKNSLVNNDIKKPTGPRLNEKESDIFQAIFRQEGEPVLLASLSKEVGIPENSLKRVITAMVNKGIPIMQTNCATGKFFYLENDFREKQLKHNVLNLSTNLTLDIFDQTIKN